MEQVPTVDAISLRGWKKPRSSDFREVCSWQKIRLRASSLRRSKLFVLVNIASSRSLSRSHREQLAGEKRASIDEGRTPIYQDRQNSVTFFSKSLSADKIRQKDVSLFNDTNVILR